MTAYSEHANNEKSETIETTSARLLTPARKQEAELLDQGAGTLDDVRQNLHEMWRMNRIFGGMPAFRQHLYPRLGKLPPEIHIVDLGTGSGRLALELQHWATQRQIKLQVFPLDLVSRHLTIAGENIGAQPDIKLIQADALNLPFAPNQIDYYISSLFMHHFEPDALITLLRNLYQCARHGIVMSDLIRGTLPLVGFRIMQPVFARHYLTRHDGQLSILRAYTPTELLRLTQAAGIEHARVYRNFPWRMTLVVEKTHV